MCVGGVNICVKSICTQSCDVGFHNEDFESSQQLYELVIITSHFLNEKTGNSQGLALCPRPHHELEVKLSTFFALGHCVQLTNC